MIADMHCDTISVILDAGCGINKNQFHLDLEGMESAGVGIQFFAAFIDPSFLPSGAVYRCMDIIDKFYSEMDKNSDKIQPVRTVDELEQAKLSGKIAAVLTIEGGEALCGKLSMLRSYYRLGVRAMTLTWNGRNEIADGIGEGAGGGLTDFGREVVAEMNRLGMIIDVSHLSERGFWDVIEVTKKPIAATHSNAKAICPFRRNLTDEQIKAIVRTGGVIGINLCSEFLRHGGGAKIDDILKHTDHILALGGEDCLALGADLDGVDSLPEGISSCRDINKLIEAFGIQGYSDALIEKISCENVESLLRRTI